MAPIDGTDGRSPTPQMQDLMNAPAQEARAAKNAASTLAASLSLSCEVTGAKLVAQGPSVVDGVAVNTRTYEASCRNGMGYFLVERPPARPTYYSCFSNLRKAGRGESDARCTLPDNANLNAMASSAIAREGETCTAQDLSRIGESGTTRLEYIETRCREGSGYILAIGLPGSTEDLRIASCADALLKLGVTCRMAANAAQANVITDDTFRQALLSRGVPCDATAVHPIGQETVKKRYVVEFKCSEQPKGLVAFIPLAGNDNPFQIVTCPTAAKAGIACRFADAN